MKSTPHPKYHETLNQCQLIIIDKLQEMFDDLMACEAVMGDPSRAEDIVNSNLMEVKKELEMFLKSMPTEEVLAIMAQKISSDTMSQLKESLFVCLLSPQPAAMWRKASEQMREVLKNR